VFTSAMRPILIVVAVMPMSPAGAAGPDGEAACPPGAEAVADAAAPGELPPLLLAELHPTASRTAAASAVISPAERGRLRIRGPAPLRAGPSLLGLTPVPSTTSLPVRSARRHKRVHGQAHNIMTDQYKNRGALPPGMCAGFLSRLSQM
jgi:hypothetical protein